MKKAQSQIITTVLIILLVLAAIVIVWQVVQTTIKNTSDQIEENTECIGLSLTVVSAVEAIGTCEVEVVGTVVTGVGKAACDLGIKPTSWLETTAPAVTVQRDTGTSITEGVEYRVFVGGLGNATSTNAALKALESDTTEISGLAVGQKVQVTPVFANGKVCTLSPEETVTAA